MPLYLTFLLAKILQLIIKRLGRGGGMALPGLLAVRLSPQVITVMARQLRRGTIVVTGTNGKTTTTRLISSILEGHGSVVIHNRTGSNLTRGIASTLIAKANWRMKFSADWGLFEVDEAVFAQVVPLLQPSYTVILNLFRDQLDRYGEIDAIADQWKQALGQLPPEATVLLNADDPLITSLADGASANIAFYGLTPPTGAELGLTHYADSRRCPKCHTPLAFSRIAYSHIGHYSCPNADFQRPQPGVWADQIHLQGMSGSTFRLHFAQLDIPITLGLAGLYNVYNVVAAAALAWQQELDMVIVQERVKNFEAVFGRLEQVALPQTSLTLILVKNPTGFNQVIQTLSTEAQAEAFWILLNDGLADGRDISWIWDTESEKLVSQAKHLIIGGSRAYDMALRMKYAGAGDEMVVAPSLAEGLRLASNLKQQRVYCLCTYTAMLSLRKLLQKQRVVTSYHRE